MKWYLDFGHGGKDSGALGTNKTKESDTVLKIGMKLSTIRERMLSRIVPSTFMDIFARNSSAVLCNMYDSL